MRGEKRPASSQYHVVDGAGHMVMSGNGVSTNEPPAKKSVVDRLPEFDWTANNYELTWKLVEQLSKPEHSKVVFPEHEIPRNHPGDTKEDVYRRVAQTIVYDTFLLEPVVCTSRMKNKTVAIWKDYSNHTRKLLDLCQKNQYELTTNVPTDNAPEEVKELWKNICLMMPVYPTLRTFMPIRSDDRHRATQPSSSKAKTRAPSGRASSLHPSETTNGATSRIPSASLSSASSGPLIVGEGTTTDVIMDEAPSTPNFVALAPILSVEEYLAIRKSYQEDVRLGIFTPAEARAKIDELDKSRRADSCVTPHTLAAPSPSPGTPSAMSSQSLHQPPTPTVASPVPHMSPMSIEESAFEEKALELGFRRPVTAGPLARLSYKEFFKTLLQHSAECDLPECRLDSRRRVPRLDFIPGAQFAIPTSSFPQHHTHAYAQTHTHNYRHLDPSISSLPNLTSSGSAAQNGIAIALVTSSGPVPLSAHPPAASIRMLQRSGASVLGIALANVVAYLSSTRHVLSGESTLWDHADAAMQAAQQRRLTFEELQLLQSRMPSLNAHLVGRESVTLFDVICTEAHQPSRSSPENGSLLWT